MTDGAEVVVVPPRIAWAVELLDVGPDDRVLEVGCGPGVAVSLVADRLGGGRVTAVDRSAVAVERTLVRNAHHVAAGRVEVHRCELAALGGEPSSFDKALSVDVNVFWTQPADAECAVLARVLRPGGTLWLVFGGPGDGTVRDVGPSVSAALGRHGFTTEVLRHATEPMVCVVGHRADR